VVDGATVIAPAETTAAGLARPDRRRPEPLWHQVEQSIRAAIEVGAWRSGSRIPGEDQLTALLGVSRITVRHALANLEAAGVLRREHGRGTFVRPARLVAGTRGLTSFTDEISALGLHVATELLDFRRVAATGRAAEALELADGDRVVRVKRLRLGGDLPIGVQTAHLRDDRVPGLSADDLGGRSMYAVLRERHGIDPQLADEIYRVGAATKPDADLLGIRRGTAVFLVERITSDERGPFEYTTSTMRGDRYEIRSSLRPV
jgi:GntR family transcriptional regulator